MTAALRSTLLVLLCLAANACGGAAYAVPPEQAAQRNDADWTIKHRPKPPEPAAVVEAAAEAQESPTTPTPPATP